MQKKKDLEELKRLLYVGVTRAKVAAYLTATVDSVEEEGTTAGVSGSLLRLLMSSATASRLINTQSTTEPTSRNDRSGCGQERQPARYRLTLDAQQAIQARAPEGAEQSDFATNDLPNTTQISVSAGNRLERIVGVVVHRVLELAASEDSLSAQDPKVPLWIEHNLSQYALTSQALSRAKIRASDLAERR